tara:strand:- start:4125 stop:5267 length:1143 start_codon:yes stop_codon:yes gene_type:complete
MSTKDTQIYHTAQPESIQSAGYKEYNNIDFVLNVGEGRSLVKNSVRVNGTINIESTSGTRVVAADNIFLPNKIGVHSVVDSIQVQFGSGPAAGLKENIANYPRFAEMIAAGQLYTDDLLNCSNMCELRAVNNVCSQLNSVGLITGSATTGLANPILSKDFSFKPHCILNRMSGDDLPISKTGDVRLTLNLARDISALMGSSQTSAATYTLNDLHVSYRSVVDAPSNSLTVMNSVLNVKSTILSGSTNVSAQVPAVCQSVSATFQSQIFENVAGPSNVALNTLPGIERVQFLFNNATNQYVTYEISDQNEMLHRYIDSFGNTGHNMVYGDQFRTNAGFGIGMDFDGSVDLSNQQFSVQLDSSVDATKPVNIYLYFHSVMSI